MNVGDLVRRTDGSLGIIAKRGYGKCFVAWLNGMSNWCVFSMLEVVNESR